MPFGPDGTDVPDTPSPLGGARYGERALDLVRFAADPVDDTIAGVVSEAAQLSQTQRDALRAAIDEDDAYALLTFVRRRTVAALRTRSLDLAMAAVRALTLVTRSRIDCRDLSVDFPLFVVRQLDGDLDEVIRGAIEVSDPSTADLFGAMAHAARTLSLRDCALIEVRSSYGLGFMDDLSGEYRPRSNLASAAVRLADSIDADGRYVVENLHASGLPEVWFGNGRRTGHLAATGCVTVSARLHGADRWSHSLLVFLAEVARGRVAADLAAQASAASTAERPRLAVAVDRRLALIIGGSGTCGEDALETRESLARYRDLAEGALIGNYS